MPSAATKNVHNVRATRRDGKLRQISLDVTKKATVQIDFDLSNANVVVTIGSNTYIVVPQPPPEAVAYLNDDGTETYAVLLKEGEATRTDAKKTNIVLDGDATFNVGHSKLEMKDDKVFHQGQWYKAGDEITINGRTALIKESVDIKK